MSYGGWKHLVGIVTAIGLLTFANCEPDTSDPSQNNNEGGACPVGPQAAFVLHISSATGYVPQDTQILVQWSGGTEPVFILNDATTWKSLDEAGFTCDVDETVDVAQLDELICEVWTTGATYFLISATDYVSYEETLSPKTREECTEMEPTDVLVQLEPKTE